MAGNSNRAMTRRFYREYREAKFPFILAHKLAKARVKGGVYKLPHGSYELVTLCKCCGPEIVRIPFEGVVYEISNYDMKPRGVSNPVA